MASGIKLKDGVGRREDNGAMLKEVYVAGCYVGEGPPTSGTTGTGAGFAERLQQYYDDTNGVLFVNEGTAASPYWTPCPPGQVPLLGHFDDFRSQPGVAVTDTAAENLYTASGLRVFGQGITETDSGAVSGTAGEGGVVLRLTTTDEDEHTIAIGTEAGVMQPDQHDLLVVEAEVTQVSAITLRGAGIGFVGTAADAFDPPVTASTTTTTLVQDDLALLYYDVGYTDADRWFLAHNKSNEAADQSVSSGGRDTGVDVAAAGTFQRLRVEVNAGGDARFFINKAQVGLVADALDADEEVSPVLFLVSESTAVKSMDVRRFLTYAYRP